MFGRPFKKHLARMVISLVVALGSFPSILASAAPVEPSHSNVRDTFLQIQTSQTALEQSYLVIERLYMDADTKEGVLIGMKRAFSDAELSFLLQDYEKSAALFENLLHQEGFNATSDYSPALFMLSESLYQSKRLHSAKAAFLNYLNQASRQKAELKSDRYQTALLRFMDLSARFGDFQNIDRFMKHIHRRNGSLPSEVAYAYGKWNFARKDLSEQERQKVSTELFELALKAGGNFAHQSSYFLGVLAVQRGDLEAAKAHFHKVLQLPVKYATDAMVQEQAHLALGRIHMEEGLFDQAIDRYQYIDYRSEAFVEALYEIAWAYVRRARAGGGEEDYTRALKASERLVATAPDSLIAPDSLVLQGHLHLQLGKYDDASAAYESVIAKFQPAYDALAQKLGDGSHAATFFEDAVEGSGKTFDLERFLPKFAIPWATTEREIAEAVRITDDIDETRTNVKESLELANHLLELLSSDRNDLFPLYQKGFTLADELQTRLSKLQSQLIDLEVQDLKAIAGDNAAVFSQLDQLRKSRLEVEQELSAYPQTKTDHDKWRRAFSTQLVGLEQEVHRTSIEADSLFAMEAAIDKLIRDSDRLSTSEKAEFLAQLATERKVSEGLKQAILSQKRQAAEERARLSQMRPNDGPLRDRYVAILTDEQRALEVVRRNVQSQSISRDEAAALHRKIATLRAKTSTARQILLSQIEHKTEDVRQEILTEMAQLKDHEEQNRHNALSTRGLIGGIAYQSFKKILGRFYGAMVKADVGLVDIAWAKKMGRSEMIQTLSIQKSDELQRLQDNFKEALSDER